MTSTRWVKNIHDISFVHIVAMLADFQNSFTVVLNKKFATSTLWFMNDQHREFYWLTVYNYMYLLLMSFYIEARRANPSNNSCPLHFSWADYSLSDLSVLWYNPTSSVEADHVVLWLHLFHLPTPTERQSHYTSSEKISCICHAFLLRNITVATLTFHCMNM